MYFDSVRSNLVVGDPCDILLCARFDIVDFIYKYRISSHV